MSTQQVLSCAILLGLCVATLAVADTVTSPPTIMLEKAVHFTAPNGDQVTVGPGTFDVDAFKDGLRLQPAGGKPEDAKVVEVNPMPHPETLQAPKAVAEALGEDALRVMLLQPDGIALEAVGTYSGVRSRGATLYGLTLSPTITIGGSKVAGTVRLDVPAPSGGLVVYLGSNSALAMVPTTVTIAGGQTTGSFSISTVRVGATSTISISAYLGGLSKSASLKLNTPYVTQVSLSTTRTCCGSNVTGTVFLNVPAPSSGLVVSLSSNYPTKATVPISVTVAGGATSGNFPISTTGVTTTYYVSISASAPSVGYVSTVLTLYCKPPTNIFIPNPCS